MNRHILACLAAAVLATAAHAQSSTPVKAGLWETAVTSSMQVQLPPEVQARLDAMTAQQKAMMPGGIGGSAPVATTTRSCSTGQTVQDLMNQAQQKGAKCTLTNQTRTADGMSYDVSCTMPQGSATGHSTFAMADSDHVSGTMHMTVQASGSRGGPNSMQMDSTFTSHYLGSDCGTIKPNASVVVTQ